MRGAGGAQSITTNINQLHEISMDEAMIDVATPNPPNEDTQVILNNNKKRGTWLGKVRVSPTMTVRIDSTVQGNFLGVLEAKGKIMFLL